MRKATAKVLGTFLFIVLFFVSIGYFASCKKGDTGEPGTDGKNGAVNMQTVMFTNQTMIYDTAKNQYYKFFSVPSITQEILDKGAILTYYKGDLSGGSWTALPDENLGFSIIYLGPNTGAIAVHSLRLSFNTGHPIDVKVVIIPPAQ